MKPIIQELLLIAKTLIAANVDGIKVLKVDSNFGSFEARQDGDNKILISPKFFKLPDEGAKLHVLLHEVGHWFRYHNVDLADIMGFEDGEKFYNLFDVGNSEEGFAESFAIYCDEPHLLKSRYPQQFEEMKQYVGSPGKYIEWAKKTLEKLESE